MKVRELLADTLEARGVTHIFGVGGASIEGLFLSLHNRTTTKVVLAKHEAAAIHMAEGYFRSTGKVGVVLATSGGGAFNTLSPLTEALASDIPLLLIAGQIPSNLEGRGGFQDSAGQHTPIDAEAIFAAVCRKVIKVKNPEDSAANLLGLMDAAEVQRGPVVLLINRDILESEVINPEVQIAERAVQPLADLLPSIELIQSAKNIVVIGGKAVLYEDCVSQLQQFVRKLAACIVLTPDAKGLWDHSDPAFSGILGVMGHQEALQSLEQADLVISIGTSLPVMSRIPTIQVLAGKTLLCLHHRPSFVTADDQVRFLNVIASLKDSLSFLLERIETRPSKLIQTLQLSFLDLASTVPPGEFIGLKSAD